MTNEIKKSIEEHIRKVINARHIIDLTVDEKLSFFHFDNNGYSYAIEFKEKDLIEAIEADSLNVQHAIRVKQLEDGEAEVIDYKDILDSNNFDLLHEPDIVAECIGNGMDFSVEYIYKKSTKKYTMPEMDNMKNDFEIAFGGFGKGAKNV